MTLLVAPCSHEAAKHAVMNWHYSQAMPAGKLVKFGAWEDDSFIGAVLYGRGANSDLGTPYGLDQVEVCELVRVALTKHVAPVSQIVALSLSQLSKLSPGVRLVVSFADPEQSHHGGIYQAGNWFYLGRSGSADEYWFKGKRWHGRSLRAYLNTLPMSGTTMERAVRVDPSVRKLTGSSKHRYVMPLDKAMRRRIAPLGLPYPRGSSLDGETPSQPGG